MPKSLPLIAATILATACSTAIAAGETQPPIERAYSPWVRICQRGAGINGTELICFTVKDGRDGSHEPDVAAVVIAPQHVTKGTLRIMLPPGMHLVSGTRVIIDSNPPQRNPDMTCFAKSCVSDYELTAALLDHLRTGRQLLVEAINDQGAALTWILPLDGFAAAYDGPPAVAGVRKLQRKDSRNPTPVDWDRPVLYDGLDPRYRLRQK